MKLFLRYLKTQLKRILKVTPQIILFSALFFAALAFIAATFAQNMNFSGNRHRISVGVVGDIQIPFFDAGISALKQIDSSKLYVDIIPLSLEEAEKQMRRGKLSAYVIIPEGFIESVECGQNDIQATYVTAAGAQGIEELLKDEVANIISTLLVNAQAGIFAMERIALKNGKSAFLEDYVYDLNVKYIKWTLDRKNFVRINELPLANGITLEAYYLCAVIAAFFTFFGIGTIFLFTQNNSDKFKFFSANGLSAFKQYIAEYLVYSLLISFCAIIIFAILFIVIASGKFSINEWKYTGQLKGLFILFLHLFPVCLLFSAMQQMLFEFISQTVPSSLLQFLVGFIFSFTGGCFYPLNFFPPVIQKIGSFLPTGKALAYLDYSLLASADLTAKVSSLLLCIAYIIIFITAGIILRYKKIRSLA